MGRRVSAQRRHDRIAVYAGQAADIRVERDQAQLREAMAASMPEITPIESNASKETIAAGAVLFAQNCAVCHGLAALGGGGVLPDLRFSQPSVLNSLQKIVIDGALADEGMPSFKQWLKPEDVDAIRAYIISRRAESTPKK